jgi:GT2 family glycosyltransferase
MTITAIITTRNRAGLLRGAIESVLRQEPCGSTGPVELIVVDDDSSDETPEVVAEYPGVRYIRTRQGTASGTRNVGIPAATGDWIAFLDDDDVWLPEKLRVCCEAIRARPDAALVGSAAVLCDEDLRRGAIWPVADPAEHPSAFEAYLDRVMTPSAVMVRRDVFDVVGLFDPGEPRSEDRDMWLRIALRGLTCLAVQEPLILYRMRDSPNGQTELAGYLGAMRVLRRHMAQAPAGLRPTWARRQRILWRLRGWYSYRFFCVAQEHRRLREPGEARRFTQLAFAASPVHFLKTSLLPSGGNRQ